MLAAVIAPAFGLLGVVLGGWLTRRSALAQDFRAAEWALYEDLLVLAQEMTDVRETTMQMLKTDYDALDFRLAGDVAAQRRLNVRLAMFASPRVRAAFEELDAADADWRSTYVGWAGLAREAARVSRSEVPPGVAPQVEEIQRLHAGARDRAAAAIDKGDKMLEAVRHEVGGGNGGRVSRLLKRPRPAATEREA